MEFKIQELYRQKDEASFFDSPVRIMAVAGTCTAL
jgi:hypothetical protein